jgi:hypothetical protein
MKDCTGPNVNDGTKLRAGLFNSLLANLRTLVRGNGNTGGGPAVVTENNADDMLLRGVSHLIQRGQTVYGVDSGSVNALVVSLSPALAEYKAGLTLRIKAANSNTGASILTANGLGAKAVVRRDGTILRDSDIISGAVQEYVYDGTSFQLVSASGRAALVRNVDLYVNGSLGNDANDGTANISGKALATIQKAIDIAFSYPPSQYVITIHVADGTYGWFLTPTYGGPPIVVVGNITTPANVVVDGTSAPEACVLVQGPNTLTVKKLKVQAGGSNKRGLCAKQGGSLFTEDTLSGAISGEVFAAFGGGSTVYPGNHTFSGNCGSFWYATNTSYIPFRTGVVFTFSTTLTVTAGAFVNDCGVIQADIPPPSFVNAGNVTGQKWLAQLNGVINTQGAGTYFPGTVSGAASSGGQYA